MASISGVGRASAVAGAIVATGMFWQMDGIYAGASTVGVAVSDGVMEGTAVAVGGINLLVTKLQASIEAIKNT